MVGTKEKLRVKSFALAEKYRRDAINQVCTYICRM